MKPEALLLRLVVVVHGIVDFLGIVDLGHQDRGFQILERHTVHNWIKKLLFRLHAADHGHVAHKDTKTNVVLLVGFFAHVPPYAVFCSV